MIKIPSAMGMNITYLVLVDHKTPFDRGAHAAWVLRFHL